MKQARFIIGKTTGLAVLALFAGAAGYLCLQAVQVAQILDTRLSWNEVASMGFGSAMVIAAFFGLAFGARWGRWAGLALGFFALWGAWSRYSMGIDWLVLLLAIGGSLLIVSLLGRSMYSRYDGRGAPPAETRADRFRLAVVKWSGVVAISFLPFIASSVWHGNIHGDSLIGDAQRPVMLALGLAMVAGIFMVLRQRTAGVLLLALVGPIAAWLFGPIIKFGAVDWIEVACRIGHTVAYVAPAIVLAAPMWRHTRRS